MSERIRDDAPDDTARLCPACGLKYGHDLAVGGTECARIQRERRARMAARAAGWTPEGGAR